MRRYSFSRHERKLQIVAWFAIRIQHDNVGYASAYEIARGLGITASTHLKGILNEMVETGELDVRERIRTGRWQGCEYMLAPGSYSFPNKRAIAVRKSGRQIGQLELF